MTFMKERISEIPGGSSIEAQQSVDLTRLDSMSREELIALVKTVGGAIWGYVLDDDKQKAEAARLKLYNKGMTSSDIKDMVPALDKWFDRTMGKASQAIEITSTTKLTPDDALSALIMDGIRDKLIKAKRPLVIEQDVDCG